MSNRHTSRRWAAALAAPALTLVLTACEGVSPERASGSPAGKGDSENVGSMLDPAAIDPAVSPCDDFYQHACGGWLATTEIPPDQPLWYRSFDTIIDRNQALMRKIVETSQTKLGDYYRACMDEQAAERAGINPILPQLRLISALPFAEKYGLKGAPNLSTVIGLLHRKGIDALFSIGAGPDFADPSLNIAHLGQAGLSLPEPGYYFPEDEQGRQLLTAYREHVAKMLEQIGFHAADAAERADEVLAVETALAEFSLSPEQLRDVTAQHNRVDRAGLAALAPELDWQAYFRALGHPGIEPINVHDRDYFTKLARLTTTIAPRAWVSYLSWLVVDRNAWRLNQAILEQNFAFFGQELQGMPEMEPRWQRCLGSTEWTLGDLLAKDFIAQAFPGQSKERVQQMVDQIVEAFRKVLDENEWMDEPTRVKARLKLEQVSYLLGYPDQWKRYPFAVGGVHGENVLRAVEHELDEDLQKVGQPVDRADWLGIPATMVNAFYDPTRNMMLFPAGILRRPMFSVTAALAENFGAIGMVIGHELTHGFDDMGSEFGPLGRLDDWWSEPSRAEFEKRTECLEQQFSSFEAAPPLLDEEGTEIAPAAMVNGGLTLGENVADLAGIKLAYQAFQALQQDPQTASPDDETMTAEQRFFYSVGQAWCAKYRPEFAHMMVDIDPHSPPRWRVNGPMTNFTPFAAAFGCAAGTPMNPVDKCEVW